MVFARLADKGIAHGTFERERVPHDIARKLSGHRHLGQYREVQAAAKLLPRFLGQAIDQSGQLLQTLLEAWVLNPESLHRRPDNHLARPLVKRTLNPQLGG